MPKKECLGFPLLCLDLELLINLVSVSVFFFILANNLSSKQNKKSPEDPK